MKSNSVFPRCYLFARMINYRIFILGALLTLFIACKKNDLTNPSNSNPPSAANNGTALITPIGVPTGTAVSKIIGPAGGKIISADSIVEVSIPVGALSSNVNITIQPMTSQVPNSVGLTYDLLPNGTQFSTPATFSFHYSDDSLVGTLPELLWVLVQDSTNAWQADPEKQDLDTTAKKLNLQISHFSRRIVAKSLVVMASKDILQKGEQSTITVEQTSIIKSTSADFGPITVYNAVPDPNVWNWQVLKGIGNPGPSLGTISEKGHQVTYHAPDQIDENSIVRVTANVGPVTEMNGTMKIIKTSVTVSTVIILHANEFDYSVYFSYKDPAVTGYIGQLYTDSAFFDMKIIINPDPNDPSQDMATATLSNIQNSGPSVIPAAETYPKPDGSRVTFSWIPDPVGLYNISTVSIINPDISQTDSLIMLNFNCDVGVTAGFNGLDEPEDGGIHFTVPSINLPVGAVAVTPNAFKINRKEQELGDPNKGYYFKFTPKTQ